MCVCVVSGLCMHVKVSGHLGNSILSYHHVGSKH